MFILKQYTHQNIENLLHLQNEVRFRTQGNKFR